MLLFPLLSLSRKENAKLMTKVQRESDAYYPRSAAGTVRSLNSLASTYSAFHEDRSQDIHY